jgi:hypothetical protein
VIEPDYFAKKRRELGMDRADDLERVQKLLDAWYPGQARAKQWHRGVLRVVTPSASVASELRMRQVELLAAAGMAETRLAISIASLS